MLSSVGGWRSAVGRRYKLRGAFRCGESFVRPSVGCSDQLLVDQPMERQSGRYIIYQQAWRWSTNSRHACVTTAAS
ncbi:unnamed protein product [Soboliphyme baturini]|uniref:Uncharacterized protein n=1 Tax=Soboliphyme baturini TaxID=241478 RepID=A0A183ITQ3_9BILA|nr:unnamed protein product [Soboliphyme baturini]